MSSLSARAPLPILVTLLLATPHVVAADALVRDMQTWTQAQMTLDLDRVAQGLNLTAEMTVRRGSPALVDAETHAQTDASLTYVFVRPSIGYDVSPDVNVALGYAFAPVLYDDAALARSRDVREHRVWEQLSLSHTYDRVSLASRSRVEERMRTRGPGRGDVALRLRERLRVAVALGKESPFSIVATDEVLFFLDHTAFSEPGFTENRAFLGLGYHGTGRVGCEVGYLHQFVGGRGTTHRSNHVLAASVSVSFAP